MKITIDKNIPIIYDFIRVITYKYNDTNIADILQYGGFTVTKRLTDAYEYIWEDLDSDVPGVELFFYYTKKYRCYMLYTYDWILSDFGDINDFLEKFFDTSAEDIKVGLMKYYDNKEREDSFYINLFKDNKRLFDFIGDLDIPITCKWELNGFVMNPKSFLTPLKELFHRVKKKVEDVYNRNNEFLQGVVMDLNTMIKTQKEYFFKNELIKVLKHDFLEKGKDIILSYSLLNETLFHSYGHDGRIIIMLGVEYKNALKQILSGESADMNDAFLKVFSDSKRMEIFRLLMNEEMFVGEIAKKMDMLLSTTSYHLDLLYSAGVISPRPHGKKVYYTVRKNDVVKKLRTIADLVEKGTY